MACWRAAGAAPRLLRQAAARHYSRHPRLEDLPDARLLPLIALVGRPNVGKSALFNRLVRRRDALVLDTPGSHVTRDYREALAQLGDLRFRVADTPGLEPGAPPSSLQGRAAVLTASVLQGSRGVLLLLDATQGLVPADEELLSWLRRNSTAAPLLLAANKADTAAGRRNLEQLQVDLAGHGLGEALPISATSGDGLADLYQLLQPLVDEPHSSGQQQQQQQQQGGAHPAAFVTTVLRRHAAPATPDDGATDSAGADEDAAMDALLQSAVGAGNASASDDEAVTGSSSYLTAAAAAAAAASEGAEAGSDDARAAASSTSPSELVRLAIIGLPNAGKSSLLNALLGYERSLTGPEPGLTRDTTAGWLAHGGHDLQLLDTAGWKRATAALPTQAPHQQQQQQQQQQQKQQRRVIEQPLGAELSRALADASLEAARRALSAAHVVLLLLDAPRLLAIDQVMSRLELQMAGLALQQGKALLLGLNKADALPGGQAAVEELRRRVADALDSRFLAAGRLPVLALSATKRQGLGALLDEVVAAYAKWNTSVSSFKLRASLAKHSLRFYGAGGSARLLGRVKWAAQLKARPPTFVLLLRGGQEVDDSGARFLAGLLRSSLGLQGVPLRLHLRYNKRKQAAGGGSSSGSSGRRSGHHKHRWRQR